MLNWLFDHNGIVMRIIDKLLSGYDLRRFMIAAIAAIVAYLLVDYLSLPVQRYLLGGTSGMDIISFLTASVALIGATWMAWYNFARWLSGTQEHTEAQVLADAKRETGYREMPDDITVDDNKNNSL